MIGLMELSGAGACEFRFLRSMGGTFCVRRAYISKDGVLTELVA
jgi:hypothetical protein